MSCNHKCSVGLLVGTKNIPEFQSLNISQNPKTLSRNTSKNPKYFPESKKLLDSGTCFVPLSYITNTLGAPLPEANHHFLNNNNIEKSESFIVVTSKLYLHND